MSELKTSQTDLDAYEVINNLPENNIKKYSIVILDLLKKITKKEPKVWGSNFIIGFGNYSYFRKNSKTEHKWFNIGFAPRKNKITLYLTCDLTKKRSLFKKNGQMQMGQRVSSY